MNKSLFPLLLVSLFLLACPDREDPDDSAIVIKNNSPIDIIYTLDFQNPTDTLVSNLPFPLIPNNNTNHLLITSNSVLDIPGAWIYWFEEKSPQILMLYFFNKDTIEQVSWERIEAENLIEKRYDLTLEILDSLNWTITYP
ncbi:MAG: hypothetical protein H6578_11045 [Chitinophagales bacterium]|nr:hypothetical protein [Chitinophagales bacterium]